MSRIYWKASSVDNLTDARFFNALNGAWIEFVFDDSRERAVTLEQAQKIMEWLFEPKIVASFGDNQDAFEVFQILQEGGIEFASVSIRHELIHDSEFAQLAFFRIHQNEIKEAARLYNSPYAWAISLNGVLSELELKIIRELQDKSKVFLRLPSVTNQMKDQLMEFDKIGIEIPTEPEQSPGMGAADIYDYLMETLDS